MLAPSSSTSAFPDGFVWGAATSAYQIEGSPLADGAGVNIWHRFSHTPGRTHEGATGDVACDHYRRWAEDVDLLAQLGVSAYRFSIAWARVRPDGVGANNPAGVAFYDRLIDALLERGIAPCVTLYHWDLPAALDDRGGWLNRDVAGWFGEYAAEMYRLFGDRVPMWATLNEPWVVMDGGYLSGGLAPGHRNIYEAPRVTHNLMRAHAAAVQAFRAASRPGRIGLVVNIEPKYPATQTDADIAAARRAEAYMNRQYLEPALLGRYPAELAAMYGEAWPEEAEREASMLRHALDFVGVNYYTRAVVANDPGARPVEERRVAQLQHTHTEMGWEAYPHGLTDTLEWVRDRYGNIPLYVTENGAAFADPPVVADTVNDPLRVAYYREHLRAVRQAIEAGVDVRGYFAWSLLDNFEWSYGYSKRFGLVHVDFATQRRTLKRSAQYYADVVRSNGAAVG